jgi:UDP-glucuronate 4-epimerase
MSGHNFLLYTLSLIKRQMASIKHTFVTYLHPHHAWCATHVAVRQYSTQEVLRRMSSLEDNSDLDSIPSVTEDENEPVKRVLVTGGAGFIGSHVAAYLLKRGDYVIIVDEMNDYYDIRLKQANLDYLEAQFGASCKIYKGDICDVELMALIFDTEHPTHICHLAARAGVRPSIVDPYIYVHSNVEGTTRLLDFARTHACKNFVYASSSSVYGCSTSNILSESDAVEKPVSPYAATKKAW